MTDVATACTTTVRVRELPLLADVGINPDEVGRRQPLVISVKLTLFGGGDRIDETIDYRRIASAAETLATTHIPLIETFARSEEHTSELQSLMRTSYAVFCLKKKKNNRHQ